MTIENVTDWRELADQLTPVQIERLTAGKHIRPDERIGFARYYAAHNLTQLALCEIPVPADVIEITEWLDDGDDGQQRTATHSRRQIDGDATVEVLTYQNHTGGIDLRSVYVSNRHNEDMTADQAREMAAALLAAADELDRLDGGAR